MGWRSVDLDIVGLDNYVWMCGYYFYLYAYSISELLFSAVKI